eukprot:TRINITY_DN4153_c0_g1_i1.p1 TRINITY_DN4153_c0_g1~~TRINITY_DN4153_c0_g1_i1.p1  ORF type:complete len:264 (-),score=72.93 TRINITY_DN4153_c0_g1_i1:70-861(-)
MSLTDKYRKILGKSDESRPSRSAPSRITTTPSFKTKRKVFCCAAPFKKILIWTNLFVMILGTGLIIMGAVAVSQLESISTLVSTTLPISAIVAGSFILVLSLLAIIGSIFESRNILLFYFFMMLILVTIEITVAMTAIETDDLVSTKMSQAWDRTSNNDRNVFQKELKCCGFNTPEDRAGDNCPELGYTIGCHDTIVKDFMDYVQLIAVAGFILAFIQAICLIFSLVLYFCFACCMYDESYIEDENQYEPLKQWDEDDGEEMI